MVHWFLLLLLAGCATSPKPDRGAAAKEIFDQTVQQYHLPSADATGPARDRLLSQAATGYGRVLREYRDQPGRCAMALRSLGNVRAAQGRFDESLRLYERVGQEYPAWDWEVLQAWKTGADLLWEAGRQSEAQQFYQRIVVRFSGPDEPAIVKTSVRAARARLAAGSTTQP